MPLVVTPAIMPLTNEVVRAFCDICAWAHEVWLAHDTFGAEVPKLGRDVQQRHGHLLHRLSIVSLEYVVLQISKLHDPAEQFGRANLSLEYILDHGNWDQSTAATLSALKGRLDTLGRQILAPARNRLVCHNDLQAHLSGVPLGGYQAGLDHEYFAALREFASLVHDRSVGGPYTFGEQAATDVLVLLKDLDKASRNRAG